MVVSMKRAAIFILAIATLVLIVSPSALPFSSSAYAKTTLDSPYVVTSAASPTDISGPATSADGGTSGGGTNQGDADGLSGLKVRPSTQGSSLVQMPERIAITMMMWWRFMVLTR